MNTPRRPHATRLDKEALRKAIRRVNMRANDGAEICQLVHSCINPGNINFTGAGIYRDDGLAMILSQSGRCLYRIRKKFISIFQDNELKITVETGRTSMNLLDINFFQNSESYQPYCEPNNEPLYIDRNSNHPLSILSRLPQAISNGMSSLSPSCEVFSNAAPTYTALEIAGYAAK